MAPLHRLRTLRRTCALSACPHAVLGALSQLLHQHRIHLVSLLILGCRPTGLLRASLRFCDIRACPTCAPPPPQHTPLPQLHPALLPAVRWHLGVTPAQRVCWAVHQRRSFHLHHILLLERAEQRASGHGLLRRLRRRQPHDPDCGLCAGRAGARVGCGWGLGRGQAGWMGQSDEYARPLLPGPASPALPSSSAPQPQPGTQPSPATCLAPQLLHNERRHLVRRV